MCGNISTDTIDTGVFTYKKTRNLLEGNKGWTYSKKNNQTGKKTKLSKEEFDLEIEKVRDDYRKKEEKNMGEQVEAKQGINKNWVIDNLDDLDSEFCKTFDKLLALYKRIMIRAYTIKEENEAKKWQN